MNSTPIELSVAAALGAVISSAIWRWYYTTYEGKVGELVDIIKDLDKAAPYNSPAGHEFLQPDDGKDACNRIIEGETWVTMDPVRCRRPKKDHEVLVV